MSVGAGQSMILLEHRIKKKKLENKQLKLLNMEQKLQESTKKKLKVYMNSTRAKKRRKKVHGGNLISDYGIMSSRRLSLTAIL